MNEGCCSPSRDVSKHHERGWLPKLCHTREVCSTFLQPFRCLLPNMKDLLISPNVVLKGVVPVLQAPVKPLQSLSLCEGWMIPRSHTFNIISCKLPSKCSKRDPISFLLQVPHYLFVRSMRMIPHVACQYYPPHPIHNHRPSRSRLQVSRLLSTVLMCW